MANSLQIIDYATDITPCALSVSHTANQLFTAYAVGVLPSLRRLTTKVQKAVDYKK